MGFNLVLRMGSESTVIGPVRGRCLEPPLFISIVKRHLGMASGQKHPRRN